AIWTEQVGQGPDVLLIGGLGDTVESWQFQLDGLADVYRLTAFDNRGAGRTVNPGELLTVESMADDAAAVLGGEGVDLEDQPLEAAIRILVGRRFGIPEAM
ncbi:MAG: hypothetical protein ABWY04_03895, partial [Arthrobacter sp.]